MALIVGLTESLTGHRHPEHPSVSAHAATRLAVGVSGLRKSFGDRVVLDGVDLTIADGELVALLGASGSGKSTLLRILAGLDDAVDGAVHVPERRAVVFQEHRLLPWRRVVQNVALGLPGDDATARSLDVLDEVGLAERARDWPRTLSGGEAQRAALARALVREPELILLDEPFGALDALTRIRMHSLMLDLWQRHRAAVLLVTHDVDEALALADRALVLAGGRIVTELTIDLPRPRRRSLAATAMLRTQLLAALGVDDVE